MKQNASKHEALISFHTTVGQLLVVLLGSEYRSESRPENSSKSVAAVATSHVKGQSEARARNICFSKQASSITVQEPPVQYSLSDIGLLYFCKYSMPNKSDSCLLNIMVYDNKLKCHSFVRVLSLAHSILGLSVCVVKDTIGINIYKYNSTFV